MNPLRVAVIGTGSRGALYARLFRRTGRAEVVAVADPDERQREKVADDHGIAPELRFADWRDLVARGKIADAVVIATPDRQHRDPAVACAGLGYDILLEKPMAPTEADAEQLAAAAERGGAFLMVCHVMRYTPYTKAIRDIVRSGVIGRIASVEHLEPIGWYHFAHSYVRGNWSRESDSSSMLLSKSCHDIDWLSYVIGQRALRVSSFGSLLEFRPERKPLGAGTRCTSCAVEPTCTYSAPRIYHGRGSGHFADIVRRGSESGDLMDALRTSDYGRCVYHGGNDAVDHQVVTIEYDGGATASFTAVAFADIHGRQTRIFGTEGSIEGDGTSFTVRHFQTGAVETHTPRTAEESQDLGDHGGADGDIVAEFLAATTGDVAKDELSGPEATLETHRITWAAERARLTGTVVTLNGAAAP